MKAIILGATGAVGKELLKELLEDKDYSQIYVLGRKSIFYLANQDKFIAVEIDFDNMMIDNNILVSSDVYVAFGTTLKQAGSKENQFTIDYTYIMNFAKLCENRVGSFNIVSAIGADEFSSNFYLSTKGKLEKDIKKLNLGYIRIFRPSLLITKRSNNRFFENLAIKISPIIRNLLIGNLKKYRPIKVNNLAKSMIKHCKASSKEIYYTYENF